MSGNSPLKSSTCHDFQASHAVDLIRPIWPIRERSVCSAHNDARGLLLPVLGWAEDEQDVEPVIKRDKARSRPSLSPHKPRCLFFADSFTSQHSSCPLSWVSPPLLFHPDFPSTFPSSNSSPLFIKSVIMPLSSLSSPRSQCYWLDYANVNQPRAQSYTADEIRHQHTRARKRKKPTSVSDNYVDQWQWCGCTRTLLNQSSLQLITFVSKWWGVAA